MMVLQVALNDPTRIEFVKQRVASMYAMVASERAAELAEKQAEVFSCN